jgi:hypothetical protein
MSTLKGISLATGIPWLQFYLEAYQGCISSYHASLLSLMQEKAILYGFVPNGKRLTPDLDLEINQIEDLLAIIRCTLDGSDAACLASSSQNLIRLTRVHSSIFRFVLCTLGKKRSRTLGRRLWTVVRLRTKERCRNRITRKIKSLEETMMEQMSDIDQGLQVCLRPNMQHVPVVSNNASQSLPRTTMYIDMIETTGFDQPISGYEIGMSFMPGEAFGQSLSMQQSQLTKEGDNFLTETADGEPISKGCHIATGQNIATWSRGRGEVQRQGCHYCGTCDGLSSRARRFLWSGGGYVSPTAYIFPSHEHIHVHRKDRSVPGQSG